MTSQSQIEDAIQVIAHMTRTSQLPRTRAIPAEELVEWQSQYDGWLQRASTSSADTELDVRDLVFAVTTNAMGGDRFNMALFNPDTVVTAKGRIVTLEPGDAHALISLCDAARAAGQEPLAYRVHHDTTCRPFTILHTPAPSSDEDEDAPMSVKRLSVYGYQKNRRLLAGKASELPLAVWELFGLVQEAIDNGTEEHNQNSLGRLAAMAQDVENLRIPVRIPTRR